VIYVNKYTTLILASGIWFIGKFLRYAFPPLFDTLQIEYSVSTTTIGVIYTCLLTVYALLQFPSGLLSDRFGSLRIIVGGAGLAAGGAFLLSIDLPIYFLVVSVVAIGVGTGVHKTVAVGILSKTYPNRTGRVLGVFDTFGTYGGVGASFIVTLFLVVPRPIEYIVAILPVVAWRGVFLSAGFVGLGFAVLFAWYVPKQQTQNDNIDRKKDPNPSIQDYLLQFKNRKFAVFAFVTILFSFSYNGVLAFLPLFLSEEAGFSTTAANLLYSVVFAVSFVQIFTGDLSDRIGRLPIIFISLGFGGVALLAIIILADIGIVIVAILIVLFALGSHGFRPVRGLYLIELLPDDIAAGGFGIVRTLLMGAGAVAPTIIGFIADKADFRVAFAFLAASMVVAAVLSMGLLVADSSIKKTSM
jgi:MFS family permease